MKLSVVGYPRIGTLRELKFVSEAYFKHTIEQTELKQTANRLRKTHWKTQLEHGIEFIPSNDFSFYDTTLDTAVLLNIIPARYQKLNLSPLDTYFAMARGYQGENGDVKALAMKKWFHTNYHYIVPELDDEAEIRLCGTKAFDEYLAFVSAAGTKSFVQLIKDSELDSPFEDGYVKELSAEVVQWMEQHHIK